MKVAFTIISRGPFEAKVRDLKKFAQKGLAKVGETWVKKFQRRHFETGAATKYGYARRSAKWMRRKREAVERGWAWDSKTRQRVAVTSSARLPLVWTGRMKEMALAAQRIEAFTTNVRVKMKAPYYVTMRGKHQAGPDKAAEMTAVARNEADLLANQFADALADDIRQPTPVTTRRT